jgi:hypothetical protein
MVVNGNLEFADGSGASPCPRNRVDNIQLTADAMTCKRSFRKSLRGEGKGHALAANLAINRLRFGDLTLGTGPDVNPYATQSICANRKGSDLRSPNTLQPRSSPTFRKHRSIDYTVASVKQKYPTESCTTVKDLLFQRTDRKS